MAQEKVREVTNPGGRGPMRGPRPKVANPGKLMKRLLGVVFEKYLFACIAVLAAILASALAGVQASLFLRSLVDDYITPMLSQASPDYAPLLGALVKIAGIYAAGVACSACVTPLSRCIAACWQRRRVSLTGGSASAWKRGCRGSAPSWR